MKKIRELVKSHPYFSGFFASFLILALFFPVSVEEGTITRCYYGEVIEKEVSEVFVPWWLQNKYEIKIKGALCSRHQKAEELYSTWKKLLKAGKKEEAQFYLKKLEALVGPGWSPAKKVAAESSSISNAETWKVGGGSKSDKLVSRDDRNNRNQGTSDGNNYGSTGGEEPGTYSGDLYSLLPVRLDGYEFFHKEEYPLQALAMARSLKDKNVLMVQFSIQRVDDQTAKKYFDSFKQSYNREWQEVKVDRLRAYWGKTDDSREALLAWRRLDLLYVIELKARVDAGNYRLKMIEWGKNLF